MITHASHLVDYSSIVYSLITFACTLNIAAIILLCSIYRHRYDHILFMCFTILSDSVNICTFCLTSLYVMVHNGLMIESRSLAHCRILSTLGYWSLFCSSWFRILSPVLWKESSLANLITKLNRNCILHLLIIVVAGLLNCHIYFFNGFEELSKNQTIKCFENRRFKYYIFPVWQGVSTIFTFAIPLIVFVYLSVKNCHVETSSSSINSRSFTHDRKYKRTLWIQRRINVMFFGCMAPSAMYYSIKHWSTTTMDIRVEPFVVIIRSLSQMSAFLLILGKVPKDPMMSY